MPAANSTRIRILSGLGLLVFLFLSTLTLLSLLEVTARVALPFVKRQGTDRTLLRRGGVGESVGWVPNARGTSFDAVFETDERGFRRIGGPARYDEAWLLLGDSVTVGVGVPAEETFPALLQAAHPALRVLGTAVIGYSIDDYVTVLRELTSGAEPVRRVILFLCLNDVAERMAPEAAGSLVDHVRFWLRDQSVFYQWLKGVLTDRSRVYYEVAAASYTNGDPGWQRLAAGLGELRRIAAQRGLDLRVVVLPYEAQLRSSDPGLLVPQRMLHDRLASLGIPSLDLKPAFAASEMPPQDLFLWKDAMHLSPAGHALAARAVEAWLGADPASGSPP